MIFVLMKSSVLPLRNIKVGGLLYIYYCIYWPKFTLLTYILSTTFWASKNSNITSTYGWKQFFAAFLTCWGGSYIQYTVIKGLWSIKLMVFSIYKTSLGPDVGLSACQVCTMVFFWLHRCECDSQAPLVVSSSRKCDVSNTTAKWSTAGFLHTQREASKATALTFSDFIFIAERNNKPTSNSASKWCYKQHECD